MATFFKPGQKVVIKGDAVVTLVHIHHHIGDRRWWEVELTPRMDSQIYGRVTLSEESIIGVVVPIEEINEQKEEDR